MVKVRVSPPMQLALIFLIFGISWIIVTDVLVRNIANDSLPILLKVQTYKGLFFVFLSAALIFIVSRKILRKQYELQEQLSSERIKHENDLALEVLNAQEHERKKLGEELHDNINQLLGVVKLYVEHAQMNPAAREEMLVKSSQYLKQVITEIRTLSRALVSPTLSDIGLVDAINDLANAINNVKDIEIIIKTDNFSEHQLSSSQKQMIYRITQEQLNNILKHSRAEHVAIELEQQNGDIRLVIEDDGVGFDPSQATAGLGLKNMRHRLGLFNGRLKIESYPQEGCRLEASFTVQQYPLKK